MNIFNVTKVVLILVCIFIVSCGKVVRTEKRLKLVIGGVTNSTAPLTTAELITQFPGGMYIVGKSATYGEFAQDFYLYGSGMPEIILPYNTDWNFKVIGWTGPMAYEGDIYCGATSTMIEVGDEIVVSVTLSKGRCDSNNFIFTKTLNLFSCNLEASTSGSFSNLISGSNRIKDQEYWCDSEYDHGRANSFAVFLELHPFSSQGMPLGFYTDGIPRSKLDKLCYRSVMKTKPQVEMKLPVGSDYRVYIQGCTDSTCGTFDPDLTYLFDSGIGHFDKDNISTFNTNTSITSNTFYSYTNIYLRDSVMPTNTFPDPTSFKRIFLTNTFASADMNGINGADTLCQTDGSLYVDASATFKAWISDSSADASFHAAPIPDNNLPYYLVFDNTYNHPGYKIAIDWAAFHSSSNNSTEILDDLRVSVTGERHGLYFWSNTTTTGSGMNFDCSTWNSSLASNSTWIGNNQTYSDGSWSNSFLDTCDKQYRLLCVER